MNKIIKLNEEEKQILNIYSKINNEEIYLENIFVNVFYGNNNNKRQVFYNKQEEEFLEIYYVDKEIKGYEMELKNPTQVNNFFDLKNLLENAKEPITITTILNNLPSYTKKIAFAKGTVYDYEKGFSFDGSCRFKIVDSNNNIYLFVFDKNNKFEGYRIDFSNKEEFCLEIFDKETIITKIFPKNKSTKYIETLTIEKDKNLKLLKGMYKEKLLQGIYTESFICPPFTSLNFKKDKNYFYNNVYIEKPNKKDYFKFKNGSVSNYFYNSEEIINLDENIINREKLDENARKKLNEFIEKQTQLDKTQKLDFFKDKELNEIFEKKKFDKKQDKNVLQL